MPTQTYAQPMLIINIVYSLQNNESNLVWALYLQISFSLKVIAHQQHLHKLNVSYDYISYHNVRSL